MDTARPPRVSPNRCRPVPSDRIQDHLLHHELFILLTEVTGLKIENPSRTVALQPRSAVLLEKHSCARVSILHPAKDDLCPAIDKLVVHVSLGPWQTDRRIFSGDRQR